MAEKVMEKNSEKISENKKGYFGTGQLISIILCVFLGMILSIVERVLRGQIIGALVALLLFPIAWIVDLATLVIKGDIVVLANP